MIYPKQNMSIGYTVLQLFCRYDLCYINVIIIIIIIICYHPFAQYLYLRI